jgi:hypothetical protein
MDFKGSCDVTFRRHFAFAVLSRSANGTSFSILYLLVTSVKWKVAPLPSFCVAQSLPP